MTKLVAVILLACAVIPSIASDVRPDQQAKRDDLRWVTEGDSTVLWTVKDIVRFDWDKQVFELRRDKAMDFLDLRLSFGQYRRFRVEDAAGTIYQGSFVSPISSMGYDGPTILTQPLGDAPSPPLFRIDGGYGGYSFSGKSRGSERFAPRLKAALEKAGVLSKIEPSSVKPIELKPFLGGWHYIGSGLTLWAHLYPETLRIGSKARFHVSIFVPDKCPHDLDAIRVEAILLSNHGTDVLVQELLRLPAKQLKSGENSFTCTFDHWADNGNPFPKASPGPARFVLKVFVEKQVNGQRTISGTYDMQSGDITLLPAESSP